MPAESVASQPVVPSVSAQPEQAPAPKLIAPAAAHAPAKDPGVTAAKSPAKAKRKFGIALYQAWCKRCGICGEFCPTGSIVNDELGTPSVADEDKCVGCMQCMQRCPDFCVEVHEKAAQPASQNPAASAPASGAAKNKSKE